MCEYEDQSEDWCDFTLISPFFVSFSLAFHWFPLKPALTLRWLALEFLNLVSFTYKSRFFNRKLKIPLKHDESCTKTDESCTKHDDFLKGLPTLLLRGGQFSMEESWFPIKNS